MKAVRLLLSVLAVSALSGCGGNDRSRSSDPPPSPPSSITSVTVSCSNYTIRADQHTSCTATVAGTGSYSTIVNWAMSGTSGGAMFADGTYLPSKPGTMTFTATSVQDPGKFGSATITVTDALPTVTGVSVNCSPLRITTAQTSTCTAAVHGTGSFDSSFIWSATLGTITSAGVFLPSNIGVAQVRATSIADPTIFGEVSIVIPDPTTSGEWTWMGGSETGNTAGIYGTLGVPSTASAPGGRLGAASWTDRDGKFWLFGGNGYDANGVLGPLNDLWKLDPTAMTWTWVAGTAKATIDDGTQPGSTNSPSAREFAASWIDNSGHLWLFGGVGPDPTRGWAWDPLNDFWEFDPAAGTWTWVSTGGPSKRSEPVTWKDKGGNLWLYGGNSALYDDYSVSITMDDLWEFDPTTRIWTQVNQSGDRPVPLAGAAGWVDSAGNFWLYGGWNLGVCDLNGYDKPCDDTIRKSLDELWRFDPVAKTWTWMAGGGNPSAGMCSDERGRDRAFPWIDGADRLWIFGGMNHCATDIFVGGFGTSFYQEERYLNSVYEYTPIGSWTWIAGVGEDGVWGAQGVPAVTNIPNPHGGGVIWVGTGGSVWIFGGYELDSMGRQLFFNDLWRYQPSPTIGSIPTQ